GTVWQYVALFVFFAVNTLLMVPIGQVLGVEFDRMAPLRAYLLNVVGAMGGLSVFALFSLYSIPPLWWFLFGLALLIPLLPMNRASAAGAGLVVGLAAVGSLQPDTYWSLYYQLSSWPRPSPTRVLGHEMSVNEDSHQQAF